MLEHRSTQELSQDCGGVPAPVEGLYGARIRLVGIRTAVKTPAPQGGRGACATILVVTSRIVIGSADAKLDQRLSDVGDSTPGRCLARPLSSSPSSASTTRAARLTWPASAVSGPGAVPLNGSRKRGSRRAHELRHVLHVPSPGLLRAAWLPRDLPLGRSPRRRSGRRALPQGPLTSRILREQRQPPRAHERPRRPVHRVDELQLAREQLQRAGEVVDGGLPDDGIERVALDRDAEAVEVQAQLVGPSGARGQPVDGQVARCATRPRSGSRR